MRWLLVPAVCAALSAPAFAQSAPDQEQDDTSVELTTGIETQQGDYNLAEDVNVLSVPTTVRVRDGGLSFSASLPWVRIDAPANVVTGGGILGLPIIVPPTTSTERVTRSGIGDLRLTGSYTASSLPVGLTLSAQVKLPTASAAKGIGTGKADVAVGAELFKTIGRVTPYLDVAYTMPGDPDGFRLQNSLSGQAGAVVRLGGAVRAHLGYAYAQAISPTLGDQHALAGGLDVGLSRRLSLGAYGSAGLSQGAPDMVAGLQLGLQID